MVATGATLVTDLLSLLVLAVVQGVESGEGGAGFWLAFAAKAAVWAVAVLWLLPKAARAFFFPPRPARGRRSVRVPARGRVPLGVGQPSWPGSLRSSARSWPASRWNRLIPRQSPLMTRLQFVGDAILVPFFLVSVGLLVDVRVLGSLEVWGLAVLFFTLVVVGKGGAALLGIPLFKFSRDEGGAVAGLTIPQAAATLAVTLIGFDIGLFEQTAVNAVVLLIVLSCLVGPSLVQSFGRRVALAEAERPYEPASAPERILVSLSNPDTAEELMELALLLRSADSEEPVYPVAVARGGHEEAGRVAEAERIMERAVIHATAASVPCVPTVRIDDNVVSGVARASRELRASEIVAGWNGQLTPGALAFGHVVDGVLAETRAMAVVARLVSPLAAARRLVVLAPPLVWREVGFARGAPRAEGARVADRAPHRRRGDRGRRAGGPVAAGGDPARGGLRGPSPCPTGAGRSGASTRSSSPTTSSCSSACGAGRSRGGRRSSGSRVCSRGATPAHNVLSVTLSEAEIVPLVAEAVNADGHEDLSLPPEHVTLDLPAARPATLLRRVLYGGFPDAPGTAARLAEALATDDSDGAPEVMPGVVFYHTHTDAVDAAQTFVGVCPGGAALPGAGQPARVLLVLLAPASMDPEAYLRHLAVTARLVRSEATVEALLAAVSPGEAHAVLFGGAPQRPPGVGGRPRGGVGSGQRAAGSGQRAAGSGQRAAGSGQRAAGSGQRAAGSGQRAAGSGQKMPTPPPRCRAGRGSCPGVVHVWGWSEPAPLAGRRPLLAGGGGRAVRNFPPRPAPPPRRRAPAPHRLARRGRPPCSGGAGSSRSRRRRSTGWARRPATPGRSAACSRRRGGRPTTRSSSTSPRSGRSPAWPS